MLFFLLAFPLKKRSGFSFQTFFAEKAQKGFPLHPLTQNQLLVELQSSNFALPYLVLTCLN